MIVCLAPKALKICNNFELVNATQRYDRNTFNTYFINEPSATCTVMLRIPTMAIKIDTST